MSEPRVSPGAAAWASRLPLAEKPRIRVKAGSADSSAADSYQNFMAAVGVGARNPSAGSSYGFNPLTRERVLLEWMYRGSWVCGVAIDAIADDMTKMGVDFAGGIAPADAETLEAAVTATQIWQGLNELIRWGRLYGGAIAVILIDGQNPATPLRIETVRPGQFRGLLMMDRWMVEPSLNDLVTEWGPDLGQPKFYRVTADAPAVPRISVHYSRVIRYIGVELPYWQKVAENLWGMSVYERLWDRLQAFDSTTQGIAQLVYRAYLRIVKIEDLRTAAAMSPDAQRGLMRRLDLMTRYQVNEGITLLGQGDEFSAVAYAFSGLDTVLVQMGQQLGGALQIPMTRLFAQSPAGLNATGDSDWRNYYDGIHQQQELRLRRGLMRILRVLAKSEGLRLPETFTFQFRDLYRLTTDQKAQTAETTTRSVLSAQELGIISSRRALEELRQSSRETGIWTTITDDEIAAAEDAPPEAQAALGGMPGLGQPGMPGAPGAAAAAPGGAPSETDPAAEPGQRETPGRTIAGPQRPNPVPLPTVSLGRGSEAA